MVLSRFHYQWMIIVDAPSRSECFGLLGVNGAGKTTTLKMLIGEKRRSGGQAWIMGRSLNDSWSKIYRTVGYCPQFDALPRLMTTREVISMFCLLRGIPRQYVTAYGILLAASFGYYDVLDRKIRKLSGGTKRKVSTSIALIGEADLLLLDEPSTGIDPVARRLLWNTLMRVRHSGRSIVITSYNMEECEALCTRATIMVNGRLKCLGSLQHLKTKFYKGFTLIIQLNIELISVKQLTIMKRFLTQSFETITLRYGGGPFSYREG